MKSIPHRVLGSASYQVGKMDVLNVSVSLFTGKLTLVYTYIVCWRLLRALCIFWPQGTPALFLILLLLNNGMLVAHVEDKRCVSYSCRDISLCRAYCCKLIC